MANTTAPVFDELSFQAQWAAQSLRESLAGIQRDAKVLPGTEQDLTHLYPITNTRAGEKSQKPDVTEFNIAIVGAGVAGLFTAMILDHLNEKYNLKAKYTILEANNPDRLGGRLFSYYFQNKKDKDGNVDPNYPPVGDHDYYDVGAMRFPGVPVMARTFALFKEVGIEPPLQGQPPVKGNLIKYYYKGVNTPALYNGVQVVKKANGPELTAADFKIPTAAEIQHKGMGSLVDEQVQDYHDLYYSGEKGPKLFWKFLMSQADPYTVRQYLTNHGFDYDTIEFLEIMNFGTRWYDQALSEMILESLDFDPKADWSCVEGGSQQIAFKMNDHLKQKDKIQFGKAVKAMSYVYAEGDKIVGPVPVTPPSDDAAQGGKPSENASGDDSEPPPLDPDVRIAITVQGEDQPRGPFHAVFNSAPLGAMQHMELEGLNLNWYVKRAIRNLGYGASCKVGIRFRTLWWKEAPYNITEGGVATTDLPIHFCVYPSYNLGDTGPGVLLASYTWSQEAERIGALISRSSPDGEERLKDLLLHDLARLHTNNDADYEKLRAKLEEQYLDHFAYNWYNDPTAAGAFAFFGPGQFRNMFPGLTYTDGKHVIIGEAASAHHAWVVGALESAVRGVYQFLFKFSKVSKAAAAAADAYAKNEVPMPYGPIPEEYDRTKEMKLPKKASKLVVGGEPAKAPEGTPPPVEVTSSPWGELARMQVLFESIRLKQGGDTLDVTKITDDMIQPFKDALVPA